MLRVHDLKEILAELPDDMPVIVAADEEGNQYHFAAEAAVNTYRREDTYTVVAIDPDDAEDDDPQALIIWP